MLSQRRRRRANIKPTLAELFVFVGWGCESFAWHTQCVSVEGEGGLVTLLSLSTTKVDLIRFFSQFIHCYWEQNVCLHITICKWFVFNFKNKSNFYPLKVVGSGSETQLQVVGKLLFLM